jgi:hypothetical protein
MGLTQSTPENSDANLLRAKKYVHIQYVPGLRRKTFLFLILRKNFRGITFFASFETPISVIKKSSSTQRMT